MIFHENPLLAHDSHEISNLIFIRKLGKISQNLSSVAVVNGALRVIEYSINITCLLIHIIYHQTF